MGRAEILDKLANKLRSTPATEEDVVYILSRIRKILEDANYPEKYSVLNFYCNLVLHIKITKPPKVVAEKLKKIASGEDYSNSIINFADLHPSLAEFLKDHNLPNFYELSTPEEIDNLRSTLLELCSDTPIKLEYVREYRVTISRTEGKVFSLSFNPVE